MSAIRNFSIIAHVDHGKSTLADRMLELTGTIEPRRMQEQVLDRMELERERGITIKMAPVRMLWHPNRRGLTQTESQKNAEDATLLYGDVTYKIRAAAFDVRKQLGLGHKESVYHKALAIAFKQQGLNFVSEKSIPIHYNGAHVGTYQPDFIVEDKVLVELKALPEIRRPQQEQLWSYLKGSSYKLALLVNFGSTDVDIQRVVFDTARTQDFPRSSASSPRDSAQVEEYILNLIDTPGHVDFSYEVSRALSAVEGVVLLVDATQGVEAQTLSVLSVARSLGRVVIPVVSKTDAPNARTEDIASELALLLGCEGSAVLRTSGKTGAGVAELLNAIVERVPPPRSGGKTQALVFDFGYSDHRGVIVYMRVFGGTIKKGDSLRLIEGRADFTALEVGVLTPDERPCAELREGEIGYVVTGIKKPGVASVGDTVTSARAPAPALAGYRSPTPVIWASVYPESQDDLPLLRQSLERLRLSDSSLSYEEESSGVMGKGFRCGFLGMLHLEIVVERLRREFNLTLVVTQPTTVYEITKQGSVEEIYAPARFPDDGTALRVRERWANVHVIAPPMYIGGVSQLLYEHEAEVGDSEALPDGKVQLSAAMPLRELMRGFFDRLKSVSSGFASLSYELIEMRDADVVRLDVLVAEELVPAFSRIVSRRRLQREAEAMVDKLEELLPKQLFELKIQARAQGRIIASRRKSALRKDVTGYLYGGDVTRKMKLLEKQKRGKKKMLARGKVDIPHEVFLKVVRES
ncbi:elongation factor 4 [Candidatus Kaiserbacteria bacterium RIFCSPHIGHO2_02_FULL_59_21]|uniref:Elongation factor 4 n=1 Tax=Candidatus Kaiserbacteria bacterium RIFCSPHIGHO2_02_FULL_59_21 TaxID=1798500 RepID=A0A1F6DZU5_9BACT|nr:MAG: elongation factor 4 [Candidatus Kaiserbacteria bacterium RIFCSPHIGHO2_01_FULL_58_22]OGG66820.1 MAG: elongation factor 4 [Candidatus Kaiserbacteria bacterium RIFCSPHIGHO2_02_FULL_59_21]OGG86346.1 MAG: elongation factor 4 [Candidatus Kaiserbacteria bacterium RIFCSPLOWO2_02_FULL_59_19]